MKVDISSKKESFKEYDIRGIYPVGIDEELIREVVRALVEKVFIKGKVVVGHDARNSSPSLYEAAINEFERHEGFDVIKVGMMTTPMLAFLIKDTEAVGGICITASHNPKEYNGIKTAKREEGIGIKVVGGKEIYSLIQ
ncbi:hypothetical protein KKH05_02445 [Patescibacteria group bacterium]|nr:hypothetical protein [Patescibacteria group bacterium]